MIPSTRGDLFPHFFTHRQIKKRAREGGRVFGKSNGQGAAPSQGLGDESGLASSGEGGSEDGDSYGSQDRRSDD